MLEWYFSTSTYFPPHCFRKLHIAPIWFAKIKLEADEMAMELLTKVKIPDQAKKYQSQLSGGQQQRVAIARALCMQPG